MPPLNKAEKELSDLQTYRNYALTSLLALIAFIFTQFDKAKILILILSSFALIFLGIVIFILQIKINKKIKEIGEL